MMRKRETKGGFIIEISPADFILSITDFFGDIIKLNDTVVSNGKIKHIPKGTKGRVVQITEPHTTNGLNVLLCEFEDDKYHTMKFSDLEYKRDSYSVKS